MNILNIQNISMDLGDRMLFEDISLGVQDQEKIGSLDAMAAEKVQC